MKEKLAILAVAGLLLSGCTLIQLPGPTPTPVPTATPVPSEVQLETPKPHEAIKSPVKITGKVPGTWFFEAQIHAKLIAADGSVLAEGPLKAKGEWMTAELVEFSGQLTFKRPAMGEQATLIIENDNPSGLPENIKTFSMPVQVNEL